MITDHTPGAFKRGKRARKGFAQRINRERVEALRSQGLPWAEVAGALEVSVEALLYQVKKWRRAGRQARNGD